MTDSHYPHLNLRDWPFNTVPSEHTAAVWVGRPDAYRKLRGLLRGIQRVDSSRIILLWAAYGAGKTHALRHLKIKARDDDHVRVLYVVTPKGIKSFLDVYRAIIDAALATDTLSELGLALFHRRGGSQATDLQRALVRLVTLPEPQTRAALAWLKAEKVLARDLRDSGLTRRLETSADGIETLNEIVALLGSVLNVKLVLLLDEIQELGQLSQARLDEAVGGLHKVFDRNTENLTLVFCFTTMAQGTIAKVIGPTLYERRSEILTLPPMSREEAVQFIHGLLAEWSIEPARAPFPFQGGVVEAVVDNLPQHDGYIPRDLIRAFDVIMRAADLDIEDNEITEIDAAYALARLVESDGR